MASPVILDEIQSRRNRASSAEHVASSSRDGRLCAMKNGCAEPWVGLTLNVLNDLAHVGALGNRRRHLSATSPRICQEGRNKCDTEGAGKMLDMMTSDVAAACVECGAATERDQNKGDVVV